MKAKKHTIKTLKDLQDVITLENSKRLLIDFSSYLLMYSEMVDKIRLTMPEETKGKTNSELCESHFIWTDDGIEGVTSIQLKEKETGKVTEIKMKK